MSKKLTSKMREALERMQAGETLIECQGRAWLLKNGQADTLNYRTFRALWNGGWIGYGRLRSAPIIEIYGMTHEARTAITEAQP